MLQELELERPRVVTKSELESYATSAQLNWPVEVVVRRLREAGWLLDLNTKGVWEFAPAARAGAFGSGDPMIELRATLARDSRAGFAVAAESAAYLLGLTSRRPDTEVIGTPEGSRLPNALRDFRVVHWASRTEPVLKDGLPVWAVATLMAFMAAKPAGYRDWPNAGEWIAQAVRRVGADLIADELVGRPRAAWARASYLLDRGGNPEAAMNLLSLAPSGVGPYYIGRRGMPGRYDARFEVVDSIGLEVEGE